MRWSVNLSRNSTKVVQLKAKLVRSFSQCRMQIEAMKLEMLKNQAQAQWQENRASLKGSNQKLRDAIAAYVDRHSEELSENRKKFIYNNVNDKLAIAIAGCRPAKFRREKNTNTFRDALDKEQLKNLELMESVVIRLIEQKDMCPLEAVDNAKERLMLTV